MSLIRFKQAPAPFRVTYELNHIPGPHMVVGEDSAWNVEEAKALADARIRYCGIPATVYIWQGEVCLWKYWKDFDNRLWKIHKPEEAPE